METEQLPWLFAIVTAAWFGWLAYRGGRSQALWAIGGAAFGLFISTVVIGLGRAISIPYSAHEREMDRLKAIAIAALLTLVVGWMLSSGLHRAQFSFWRKKNDAVMPPAGPEGKNPQPAQSKTTSRATS